MKRSSDKTGVTIDGVTYTFHGDYIWGTVTIGTSPVLIVGDGGWEFYHPDQDGMTDELALRVLAHF